MFFVQRQTQHAHLGTLLISDCDFVKGILDVDKGKLLASAATTGCWSTLAAPGIEQHCCQLSCRSHGRVLPHCTAFIHTSGLADWPNTITPIKAAALFSYWLQLHTANVQLHVSVLRCGAHVVHFHCDGHHVHAVHAGRAAYAGACVTRAMRLCSLCSGGQVCAHVNSTCLSHWSRCISKPWCLCVK